MNPRVLLTVIIPAHNPAADRLDRTLAALRAQTLDASVWELILVDNASSPPIDAGRVRASGPRDLRVITEPQPGLTFARRCGLAAARGRFIVLVDDDNLLQPDYLARVVELFEAHPRVGACGGKSVPEFAQPPAPWVREFDGLLACRDLGANALISSGLIDQATGRCDYPAFAPIGAGLALRREAAELWLSDPAAGTLPDRQGRELTSGGDNDIILTLMRGGWEVAYFPNLSLTHLIPAGRTDAAYLGRLNRGIQKSWMQVLARHGANPWPAIPRWTLPLRMARAWLTHRAWSSAAARIRWQGACGHFEGRVRR